MPSTTDVKQVYFQAMKVLKIFCLNFCLSGLCASYEGWPVQLGWKNQTVRAKYPKYASSQDIIDPQTFQNGFKIGLSDGYINENGDLISERLRNRVIPHCSEFEYHIMCEKPPRAIIRNPTGSNPDSSRRISEPIRTSPSCC